MARVSFRYFGCLWTVSFLMKDGCFFPKGLFCGCRQNFRGCLSKNLWIIIGGVWMNVSKLCWRPGSQGTYLEPDFLKNRRSFKSTRIPVLYSSRIVIVNVNGYWSVKSVISALKIGRNSSLRKVATRFEDSAMNFCCCVLERFSQGSLNP